MPKRNKHLSGVVAQIAASEYLSEAFGLRSCNTRGNTSDNCTYSTKTPLYVWDIPSKICNPNILRLPPHRPCLYCEQDLLALETDAGLL